MSDLCERLELYSIALTYSMRSEEERARLGDLRCGPHMAADAMIEAAAHIARLTSALEQIRDTSGKNYDSDRAWALALQLRAQVALKPWGATLEALRPSTEGDK